MQPTSEPGGNPSGIGFAGPGFEEANYGSCDRCGGHEQRWRDVAGGPPMCWSCHHDERLCTTLSIDERCWSDYLADDSADPFEPEAPRGVSVRQDGAATQRCTASPLGPVLATLAKAESRIWGAA